MKPIHHFVVLMLTVAMLDLAISLPTTKSAQAVRPGQSAEERIRATLEDANQALGGDFVFTPDISPLAPYMSRQKQGGINWDGSPIEYEDHISISLSLVGNSKNCEILIKGSGYQPYTFHGMQGCGVYNFNGHPFSLMWETQDVLEINGYFNLRAGTSGFCVGDKVPSCDIDNALPLAEALHQAAIKNGLYKSMPEEILPINPGEVVPGQPGAPVVPGEVIPGQPGAPIEPSTPAETGGLFGIPLAVILASLGIPVAGALSGAAVSALISAMTSAATAAAPIQPPFTRELDPDELSEYEASGQSKEEFIRAKTIANLSRNLGEEYNKFSPADQANLVELHQRVQDLVQKKLKDRYYVMNPDDDWSIPFLPNTGVENMANELMDRIGMLNDYKGGRCGEYTNWGGSWTKDLLNQTGFRGQDICVSDIEIHWSGYDNHGATEARFPNEIRVVVDYQQSFQKGKPVIFSEKNWITYNSVRCSQLLITPEILYDGVSGCQNSLKALFDSNTPRADIQSKFIEQSKDKPEARAIVREFYRKCLKDFQIKNPPPPKETPAPDLQGLVDKLPR